MATTRKTLRQDIIRKLYPTKITTSTTNTINSSSTKIIDTIFASIQEPKDYRNAWFYIVELVGDGPQIGEVARTTHTGQDGIINLLPAMTGTIQNETDYEIHYVFHPEDINDTIDDIIRVGTKSALGALTSDSSTTILERDVVVDGVLSFLKRQLAVGKNQIDTAHLNEEAQFHEDRFRAGILRLGYPPLTEF